jgi:hypothetical protein
MMAADVQCQDKIVLIWVDEFLVNQGSRGDDTGDSAVM